jgi:tetratricopeptide (TPR) repeat protein
VLSALSVTAFNGTMTGRIKDRSGIRLATCSAGRGHAWKEAEEAYRKSLQLLHDPADQGQVWHSLGNLLSRQSPRWKGAEEAYRKSLQLLHDPADQAQVWHSLGNLLSRQSPRWKEAEEAYQESLQLRHDPAHQGQVWHSLGNLLSRQSPRWKEAEEAYHKSLRLLHDPADQGQVWHSLGNWLSRQNNRWQETEESYRTSLRLLPNPAHQGRVYSSWAGAIVANRPVDEYEEAEEYARLSLSLLARDLRAQSTVNGILARLYEAKGQYSQAIAALTAAIEADERPKNLKQVRERQQHLEELRRKI